MGGNRFVLCAVPAPVAALSGEARNSTFCKVASGPARRVLRQAFDGAARWPEKSHDRRKLYRSTQPRNMRDYGRYVKLK